MSGEYFRKSVAESNGIVGTLVLGGDCAESPIAKPSATKRATADFTSSSNLSVDFEHVHARAAGRAFTGVHCAFADPRRLRRRTFDRDSHRVEVMRVERGLGRSDGLPHGDALVLELLRRADAGESYRPVRHQLRESVRLLTLHLDEDRAERRIARAFLDMRHVLALKRYVPRFRRHRERKDNCDDQSHGELPSKP